MPNTADADDYWGQAVNLLTGFPMPVRKTLFDSLKSADGIPLFRIQLDRFAVRPVSSGDMGWHVSPGEDFDVVFYGSEDGDGAHPIREMNRIRIVFIGVANDANGKGRLADPGETGLGGKFSSSVEDVDWDVGPLSNYVGGPRAALNALLSPGNGYSTRDVEYNGTTVADADAVDLMSFRHTADSFDRTAQFFVQQAKVLQQWETSLGEEQAAWKGQAAGLFWNLIHEVRKNYDSYVEQVGGEGYQGPTAMIDGHRATSTPGEALAVAQQQLQIRATNLRDAWDRWADGWHDPHRYVLQILEQDIAPWIAANNWPYIQKHTASTGYGASTTYSSTPEFKMDHPTWGQLWNTDTWRKIGEEAVKRWNDRVEAILGTAGAMVLADLKNNWIDASSSFEDALRTVSQDTLSDIYQQEEAEIAQEQADQQAQDLNSSLNDLGGGLGDIGDSLSGLNDGLGDLGNGINDGLNGFSSSLNGPGGTGDLTTGLNGATPAGGGSLDSLLNPAGTSGDPSLLPPSAISPLNPGPGAAGSLTGGMTNPDGSVTTLNPDGTLTTTSPDGTVTQLNPSLGTATTTSPNGSTKTTDLNGGAVVGPDGSVTVTNPDGTVTTTYPDGTVTTLNPDTGTATSLNPDGTLTTIYPDGSTTTVAPDTGLATTTNPDGSTVTTDLNNGPLQNPDGSTTTLNPDGSLTTSNPGGSVTTLNPDTGALTTSYPDGTITSLNPDTGDLTSLHPDGTLTTSNPDGGATTVDPDTGLATTTNPDGSTVTTDLNNGPLQNPDGSTTTLNPDTGELTTTYPDGSTATLDPNTGALTTTYPDGTSTIINPDTGTATTTNPDGSTVTTDLNGPSLNGPGEGGGTSGDFPSSLNDGLNLPSSLNTDLHGPTGSGVGAAGGGDYTGALNNGLNTGGTGSSYNEPYYDQQDPTQAGRGLGSPVQAAQSPMMPGGMPLNPGMGGSRDNGNSERVRNVFTGSGGATMARRNNRPAALDEEDDVVITRGGTATTSGAVYPAAGGPSSGLRTEGVFQGRSSWVTEDEDVWGTDEGGAPAVIGR